MAGTLRAKTGLPVRSAVLVLEPAPKIPEFFEVRHGADVLSSYHFRVMYLYEVPATALAADPALAVLASFGQGARLADIAAARDTLSEHVPRPERADLLAALYIMSGRHFPMAAIRRILSQETYMESVTYREILETGISKGTRHLVGRLISRRFPEAAPQLAPLLDRCTAEDLEEVGEAVLMADSPEALRATLDTLVGAH